MIGIAGPVKQFTEILGHTPDYPGADYFDLPDGELLHLQYWVECLHGRKDADRTN